MYALYITKDQTKQNHILFPWKWMQLFTLISETTTLSPECRQEVLRTNTTLWLTKAQGESMTTSKATNPSDKPTEKLSEEFWKWTKKPTPNQTKKSGPHQQIPIRDGKNRHLCPVFYPIGVLCGAIRCDIPYDHCSLPVLANLYLICIPWYKWGYKVVSLICFSNHHYIFFKRHHLVYWLLQPRI